MRFSSMWTGLYRGSEGGGSQRYRTVQLFWVRPWRFPIFERSAGVLTGRAIRCRRSEVPDPQPSTLKPISLRALSSFASFAASREPWPQRARRNPGQKRPNHAKSCHAPRHSTGSVMDCGGKPSATPLSHATSSNVRRRRSAGRCSEHSTLDPRLSTLDSRPMFRAPLLVFSFSRFSFAPFTHFRLPTHTPSPPSRDTLLREIPGARAEER